MVEIVFVCLPLNAYLGSLQGNKLNGIQGQSMIPVRRQVFVPLFVCLFLFNNIDNSSGYSVSWKRD